MIHFERTIQHPRQLIRLPLHQDTKFIISNINGLGWKSLFIYSNFLRNWSNYLTVDRWRRVLMAKYLTQQGAFIENQFFVASLNYRKFFRRLYFLLLVELKDFYCFNYLYSKFPIRCYFYLNYLNLFSFAINYSRF